MKQYFFFIMIALCLSAQLPARAGNTRGAVLWSFQLPLQVKSYETFMGDLYVVNNRVYFTSGDALLHCLDAATGRKVWTFSYLVSVQQNWADHGIDWRDMRGRMENTPINEPSRLLFSENRIYFTARTFCAFFCSSFCVDAATGRLVWRKPLKAVTNFGFFSVHNGRAYHEYGCMDGRTGKTLWDEKVLDRGENLKEWILVSDDKKNLLFHRSGHAPLNCYTGADFRPLWNSSELGRIEQSIPLAWKGHCFLFGMDTSLLSRVEMATGEVSWASDLNATDHVMAQPQNAVLDDERLYLYGSITDNKGGDPGIILALDQGSGRLLWKTRINEANDRFYEKSWMTTVGGKIYFLESPLNLVCLSGTSGRRLWTVPCAETKKAHRAFLVRPAISGDRAYVLVNTISQVTQKIIRREILCLDIGEIR
jgi:outer membrane protein assembly factor BamB